MVSVATAPLKFGPSLACLETPALRGYGQDADSILCLNEELKRPCFVGGSPVFCASAMSKSQVSSKLNRKPLNVIMENFMSNLK